jgi:hypothetical protein
VDGFDLIGHGLISRTCYDDGGALRPSTGYRIGREEARVFGTGPFAPFPVERGDRVDHGSVYGLPIYEGDGPAGFIVEENLLRRHLDPSQRAMSAARMANMPLGGYGYVDRSANLHFDESSSSAEQAAVKFNVGRRSVFVAKDGRRRHISARASWAAGDRPNR